MNVSLRVTKEDADDKGGGGGLFKLPFSGTTGKTSLRFSCFPTPGNKMSVLIEWSPETSPAELLSIKSSSEVGALYLETNSATLVSNHDMRQ